VHTAQCKFIPVEIAEEQKQKSISFDSDAVQITVTPHAFVSG